MTVQDVSRRREILGRRVAVAALIASLVPALAARADRSTRQVSRFQQPAAERKIETGSTGEGSQSAEKHERDQAEYYEPLEESAYLRERPDALGAAAHAFANKEIERLLEEREKLVVVRRNQAIDLLEKFIRSEPENVAEMADALLRLAELRWEEARADYLEAFGAWQKQPQASRGPAPKPDYGKAMSLYDRLLTRHRDFDRYDLVLYMKAYALIELGQSQAALGLYQQILRQFPDSRFVPDAHFALAESAFTGTYDYATALSEYEKVLKHPDSELYDIALFKSAWCLWKLGRNKDAATRFRKVLDLGKSRARMTSSRRRRLAELRNEALDYLIQVFVEDESNTAKDLFAFLRGIGGEDYAYEVMGRLSQTYMDQDRYARAVGAYALLLQMDPTSAAAPRYQQQIAHAYAEQGDQPKTIEALRVLAATYGHDGTWAHQQSDPDVVHKAEVRAEKAVRQQALLYHQRGQKEKQTKDLEAAADLYRVYLKQFPHGKSAYEIQFYLGEILFHHLQQWSEAGDAYLAAARIDPHGQFTRDALYNAIGAYEHVREQEIQQCVKQRQKGADVSGGCGETDNDKKFADAIGMYVDLYPDDPDLPEILFRQGRLYYDRAIYDPAVKLFGQLLERFPKSEYAAPAGELILDSFNRAKDYQNIEKWARRLKKAPAFASDDKQKRLDGLILQAMFKIGEQLASKDEPEKAADAYFRAAQEFPQDARAREALYNAGLMHQRAGNLAGAGHAYDALVDRYPGSGEGAKGAWAAAQMYESIAQFSDAAEYYEAYADKFSKQPKAPDALYNAVLLRVTAGDDDSAVKDGQEFVHRYPQHDAVDDVYFFIGRADESSGHWADAARTYRRYVRRSRNPDRQVEAQTRLAQVLLKAGQDHEAERALDKAVKLGRRYGSQLGDGVYYAAQARYLQGDRVLAQYEAIKIAGPVKGLRDRLQQKSELLKKAALIYTDVIDFGVAEWITASLYQIGRSYEMFAEAMRQAPVPQGLNDQEKQAYQDQLMMFVVPMEERALQAYEGGYKKALELRIFNKWTQKLREGLTRLNDVQYPPLREMGAEIVRSAPLPMPQLLDGLRRGGALNSDEAPTASAKRGRSASAGKGGAP